MQDGDYRKKFNEKNQAREKYPMNGLAESRNKVKQVLNRVRNVHV